MVKKRRQPALRFCKHKCQPASDGEVNHQLHGKANESNAELPEKVECGDLNVWSSQLWNEFHYSSGTQSLEARGGEVIDKLSQMPHDILLPILSTLKMKEAARMSVVSHRWNYMWRCLPVLRFKNKRTMRKMWNYHEAGREERSKFVAWVNHVVDEHLGPVIDELRVAFDLDQSWQSDIDKWLAFALRKEVKLLEVDLNPVIKYQRKMRNCTLPLDLPGILSSVKPLLRTLRLKHVDVYVGDIKCLLRSCPFLEVLCIEESARIISLSISGSSLKLKHLEVSHCPNLKTLDICAPNLLSFTHYGRPLKFHIGCAPLLSKVSIGGGQGDLIDYAFDCLSNCFSQLEHLTLKMDFYDDLNPRIKNFPPPTNLKHLELHIVGESHDCLLGWASFIEASPVLEKLTVKFNTIDLGCGLIRFGDPIVLNYSMVHDGRPLRSLKTLYIGGFAGQTIDIGFATYVFKHATSLEKVTVIFDEDFRFKLPSKGAMQEYINELKGSLPRCARLFIK